MGTDGLLDILNLPQFKPCKRTWKEVSSKVSVLCRDGMVALNKLMGYMTDAERKHRDECREQKKPRQLCVVPKSTTGATMFVSASFLYDQWKQPMWEFQRSHRPVAQEHKQTFGIISHDKPHHAVPFSLKDECRAKRSKGRDLVPKIPVTWKFHANGYYTDEMLQKYKVASPDALPLAAFYSIPVESMLRTSGRMAEFTDFLHSSIMTDSTLPSYSRLLLDWKRGETVIVSPAGSPVALPDNELCESDVSVPFWIAHLARTYPQDTAMRGAFCVETTDSDTLPIQMLQFGLNPRVDVYWRKNDKDDTCYRVRDIIEAARKAGYQKGEDDAVLIQALVVGMILTGCDHWTKTWMIYMVNHAKTFETVAKSKGIFPLVPLKIDVLAELVSNGDEEEKLSYDAKLALKDGVLKLKRLYATFKEMAGKKFKEDKVKFTPKPRFLKLCSIIYYWSDPNGAQAKSRGFVSSKNAGEKHKARANAKRKADTEDEDQKSVDVSDSSPPHPKRAHSEKHTRAAHSENSQEKKASGAQSKNSSMFTLCAAQSRNGAPRKNKTDLPVQLKFGQKRSVTLGDQIASDPKPVKRTLSVPIFDLK
jgi:hypothetical protein